MSTNKQTQDENPLNAEEDPVTEIPLSHYIPDAVLRDLLTGLQDGNAESTVSSDPFDYAPYGQSKMGTITVTLTKSVTEEAKVSSPDTHETQMTGNPVETYTLTVEYKPLTGDERKNLLIESGKIAEEDQGFMHNGDDGPGKEVIEAEDPVISTNVHRIIVYAKGLQITKTDPVFTYVLKGASFALYRTARTGEQNQEELAGLTGKYVRVTDLDTRTDGFAAIDELPMLKENEAYYLVETQAPQGYVMLDHPIRVKLETVKQYYTPDRDESYIRNNEGADEPETTLYSMAERSRLMLADDPAVRRTNADGSGDLTHVGLPYDLDGLATMFYGIANNPGVELPATGGPGTKLFTILGSILILGAGVLLWRRRRFI